MARVKMLSSKLLLVARECVTRAKRRCLDDKTTVFVRVWRGQYLTKVVQGIVVNCQLGHSRLNDASAEQSNKQATENNMQIKMTWVTGYLYSSFIEFKLDINLILPVT